MVWESKNFEEKMNPYIDEIYKNIFSELIEIKRSNREKTVDSKILFMDKELAIDTFLYFKDGSILTLQEKTRKINYLDYDDFTFEYFNDPITKDKGEWFKLAAQLYFYGYANQSEDGYIKYYLIIIPKLRIFLEEIGIETLTRKYLRQNKPPAKANFFAVPFRLIPKNCIYIEKGELNDTRNGM